MLTTSDQFLSDALTSFEARISTHNLNSVQTLLVHPYNLKTTWRAQIENLALTAVFLLSHQQGNLTILGFVTDKFTDIDTRANNPRQYFYACAIKYDVPVFNLTAPVPLNTVCVPKPWGQEIWYSGMEERGESGVSSNDLNMQDHSAVAPLSWYLSMAGDFTHKSLQPMLLKILDPSPEPIKGDLYFELHEQKHEVYVVTHIDTEAWPSGIGGIRLGMNPEVRSKYADDDSFRDDYLNAIKAYKKIRDQIDSKPASSQQLSDKESQARSRMESFTATRPLRLGDAIVITPNTPHSLLHGVRVVEFQTPVYERQIISFAQKVLTQPNWDSEIAVQKMNLDVPKPPNFKIVENNPGILVEEIARFEEFRMWRIELEAGCRAKLNQDIPYAICIGISGSLLANELELGAEQACFIPGSVLHKHIYNNTDELCSCLVAAPDL